MPKKMNAMLLIAMSVMLSFAAGCSCKHEWAEATCKEPKTCTLCGETEGEVIAHEWVEATCDTPKTCVLCGETEGDFPGHIVGEWVIEGTEVVETCINCGFEYRREASAEEILLSQDELLLGRWVSTHAVYGDQVAEYEGFMGIEILSDGTMYVVVHRSFDDNGYITSEIPTVIEAVEYDEEENVYTIDLKDEESNVISMFLGEDEDGSYIGLPLSEYACVFFELAE